MSRMPNLPSLFDLFGGVRPMARELGEAPSSVSSWKRVGRIPAEKQPYVLEKAQALGLPVSADHVVFPNGRPLQAVTDLTELERTVAFDRQLQTKQPASK